MIADRTDYTTSVQIGCTKNYGFIIFNNDHELNYKNPQTAAS